MTPSVLLPFAGWFGLTLPPHPTPHPRLQAFNSLLLPRPSLGSPSKVQILPCPVDTSYSSQRPTAPAQSTPPGRPAWLANSDGRALRETLPPGSSFSLAPGLTSTRHPAAPPPALRAGAPGAAGPRGSWKGSLSLPRAANPRPPRLQGACDRARASPGVLPAWAAGARGCHPRREFGLPPALQVPPPAQRVSPGVGTPRTRAGGSERGPRGGQDAGLPGRDPPPAVGAARRVRGAARAPRPSAPTR